MPVQLRAQPGDDLSGADLAILLSGLQRDVDEAGVGGAAAAGKGDDIGYRGSFLITPTICLMELSMAGKEESCGPLHAAGDCSGILRAGKSPSVF
jgi:hypothetical protein